MFKFEKLSVGQKAIAFSDLMYVQSNAFPADERFALTDQIRRAVVSIPSNIAERSARADTDYAKFVSYATGSLYEVVTQAFIARRRSYLDEKGFTKISSDAEEIGRMLSGLRDSLRL